MHGCGKEFCVIEEIVDDFEYGVDGFRCRCKRCELVTETKPSENGAICEWLMNNMREQLAVSEITVVSSRQWKGV